MNPFRKNQAAERMPVLAQAPTPKDVAEGVVQLRLYDPIDSWGGPWGVSAKEFTDALDSLPYDVKEIRLLINSPGGEVTEGIAILNALRAHKARVVAVVEGMAASAASFIAAGVDELVMMRNSQLFIHNAWGVVIGDAEFLREVADELENYYDRNIADIYARKSGKTVEHWLAEMSKDRHLSADEAVTEGLADRVEGEASEEARNRFDASVFARPRPGVSAKLPSSSEPEETNQKEEAVMADFIEGVRERLGLTDAEASEDAVLAALDERLATPELPVATIESVELPEGVTMIDSAVLADLQAQAAQGVEARTEQARQRREGILAKALNEGRIAPASREKWAALLEESEESTTALLESLPKNTIPVEELGHADPAESEEKKLYAAAWGEDQKEAS